MFARAERDRERIEAPSLPVGAGLPSRLRELLWETSAMQRYVTSVATSAAILLAACGDPATRPGTTAPTSSASASLDADLSHRAVGGVYVGTNDAQANAVVAFARLESGALLKIGEFKTGGAGIGGTADPLQSQGSVILSANHKRLYVVNAGSNSVSTFAVLDDASLHLLGTVGSGGRGPISMTLTENRLYVLNADNSIAGFSVGDETPRPILRSRLSLGASTDGPSTINAGRDGRLLFVTQRDINALDVVTVRADGELTAASRRASSGIGPFGFAVTSRDQLIVSEAAGTLPNGAVSSYRVAGNNSLSLISATLSTHQAATCWLVLTKDEHFAYVANAGSGSLSGYEVASDGSLSPLDANGRTGVTNGTGAAPLDMDLTRDGKFLYVLQTGTGTVGTFAIGSHGRLSVLPDTPGLSANAGFEGIAVY
ncbi:MAG: beta-propeller fold lactonase family protein [bacterium]